MLKYSLDDELFQYDSGFEAIQDMDEPEVGNVYYSCEAVPVDVDKLVRDYTIETILENLDDALYNEIANEDCFPFYEVSKEAKQELHDMIVQWAKKHTNIEAYWTFVGKSTKHFVTEEDMKELNDD